MTATGHEDEFRRLFEEEATVRLGALAEQALELETRGGDAELIAEMFRNAHTLKGGAGIVGFSALADVVHELESLIGELREGRRAPDAALADAVLATVDALRDMVARAMAGEDQDGAAIAARAALARADVPRPLPVAAAPAAPASAPAPAAPRRDSIAVPVGRLDDLVRLVGEGAAAQLRVGRLLAERLGREPSTVDEYRELSRVIGELQDRAMRARMVSVATIAGPLRQAARELARSNAKQIAWEIAGADTEVDRHVLEALREPLVALVRNAVDHGIEPPDERIAAGKDPTGRIRVHAMQLGGEVIVAVADDGRGIDLARVREKTSRGLSDAEALDAIFQPGVTTAREVTGVSGRGVGLDAVRAAVEAVRGRVEVRSHPGHGSEFRLIVPLTLAILRCLIVEAGGRRYALPMPAAVSLLSAGEAAVSAEGRPAVWFGGDAVPVADLGALVGAAGGDGDGGPLVVLSTPAGRHALRVSAVTGQRDVVVKDLGALVPRLALVAGASVEPDGSLMLVLDPTGLLHAAEGAAPVAAAAPAGALEPERPVRGRVLVVDDALTIRELQRSILERAGYAVTTAVDGEDALRRLDDTPVDLVLTDIEMPVMDGLALTEAIRASGRHAGLPVVILTSRTDDADRRRGLEAGADAYLVKRTFDEQTLLTAVARLLGGPR